MELQSNCNGTSPEYQWNSSQANYWGGGGGAILVEFNWNFNHNFRREVLTFTDNDVLGQNPLGILSQGKFGHCQVMSTNYATQTKSPVVFL